MGHFGENNLAFEPSEDLNSNITSLKSSHELNFSNSMHADAELGVLTRQQSTSISVTKPRTKFNFNFTTRQWTIIAILGLANLFRGISVVIGGPFYPPEAKDRGISDTWNGFVFGSYDISTFAVSFFFGKFIIPALGPRLVLKLSTTNLGIMTTLFGCLQFITARTPFLALSFIIRIIAGMGDAGFYPAAFVIFAQEFDGDVSTVIGLYELLFGIGAIGGPVLLGLIKDSTGFFVVYAIPGVFLIICAVLNHLFVPKEPARILKEEIKSNPDSRGTNRKWYHVFIIPTVLVVLFNLFTTAASIGFITGTLETHLDSFGLSSFQVSAVFIVSNSIYTVSTPVWGKIADNLVGRRRNILIFVGAGFIFLGFSLMGPLPFLYGDTVLWSTVVGLGIHGMGIGAAIMSAFPQMLFAAIADGLPDTEKTNSLISSLYIQTFTLGNAIGPMAAGVLMDNIGFQNATLLIVGFSAFVITLTTMLTLFQRKGLK